MTEKAKRIVAALRVVCDERSCEGCPCSDWCHKRKVNCLDDDAADLIESLSAQLEQVTRERDAAVKDMYHASSDGGSFCDICVYKNNGCDEREARDIECFEWRGVEVE